MVVLIMDVFDTNVWVAALRSRRGASFIILKAIRQGLVVGVVSQALLLEYVDVLKRDANLEQFWMDANEVEVILGVLADRLIPVPIYYKWRPQLSDPNDEMVLECAIINAQAESIITFNKRDFLPAASQSGIEILAPGDFVRKFNLVERINQ